MFDYTKTEQIGLAKEKLSPHPDGKAWPKCCRDLASIARGGKISCAFIRTQEYGARLTSRRRQAYLRVDEIPFMCVHRKTDDGYHRVCAGWDACFGNKHHGEKL